jgi:hypothetical protein
MLITKTLKKNDSLIKDRYFEKKQKNKKQKKKKTKKKQHVN